MSLQFLKDAVESPNVKAFMEMIRKCEGTNAADGYSYIFGSSPHNTTRFSDFSKHPNIPVPFGTTASTAAGAYQILYRTWTAIQRKYDLPDFSPASQDIACAELFSQRNCLQKLIDGDFDFAIKQCNTIWASLPGSPYGQPTHSLADAQQYYTSAGGTVA